MKKQFFIIDIVMKFYKYLRVACLFTKKKMNQSRLKANNIIS